MSLFSRSPPTRLPSKSSLISTWSLTATPHFIHNRPPDFDTRSLRSSALTRLRNHPLDYFHPRPAKHRIPRLDSRTSSCPDLLPTRPRRRIETTMSNDGLRQSAEQVRPVKLDREVSSCRAASARATSSASGEMSVAWIAAVGSSFAKASAIAPAPYPHRRCVDRVGRALRPSGCAAPPARAPLPPHAPSPDEESTPPRYDRSSPKNS